MTVISFDEAAKRLRRSTKPIPESRPATNETTHDWSDSLQRMRELAACPEATGAAAGSQLLAHLEEMKRADAEYGSFTILRYNRSIDLPESQN